MDQPDTTTSIPSRPPSPLPQQLCTAGRRPRAWPRWVSASLLPSSKARSSPSQPDLTKRGPGLATPVVAVARSGRGSRRRAPRRWSSSSPIEGGCPTSSSISSSVASTPSFPAACHLQPRWCSFPRLHCWWSSPHPPHPVGCNRAYPSTPSLPIVITLLFLARLAGATGAGRGAMDSQHPVEHYHPIRSHHVLTVLCS